MKFELPFTKETGRTRPAPFQYVMLASLPFSFYFLTIEQWLLSLAIAYVIAVFGQSSAHHRYFCHRTFKVNIFWHYVMLFVATILSIGSVLEWTHVHLYHHATADTKDDPHSPMLKGRRKVWFLSWFNFVYGTRVTQMSNKLKNEPGVLFFHTYYVYIIFAYMVTILLIEPKAIYALFFFPMFLSLVFGSIVNSVMHTLDGRTRNIKFVHILTGGEGDHDLHHKHPHLAHFTKPDVGGFFIRLIKTKDK